MHHSYEITYLEIFKGKKFYMSIVVAAWQIQGTLKKLKANKDISKIDVKIYIPE